MEQRFQQLYREMAPKLGRQATFLLGDPAAAEDLVQEAFLRLHRTGLDTVEHPAAWLSKVISNLCYSHLRSEGSRRQREEKVFLRTAAEMSATTALSAEQVVLEREEARLTRLALDRLQSRDRLVLLLKFSGFSYDEIAAATEIGRSSVGTVLIRARERFKKAYEQLLRNQPHKGGVIR
ncbi:sigma-70 family RNA polymerase sigma factor [Heliobacterium undosum]|uniref:Sigma-70 family RNA polymerase sigma factor n=2 Tax=Heliomicrobium undosum TaxID=121734 RepID=A0A845L6Q9_9FIRM|nr:sigma-70 family RNA polymerase sigma factor [Heliomicrobium undosum]